MFKNETTTKDEFYRAKHAPWFEGTASNILSSGKNFDFCAEVNPTNHLGINEGIKPTTCEEVKKELGNILALMEMKRTTFYTNKSKNRKEDFKSGVTYYKPPEGVSDNKYSVNYDSKDNYLEGCSDGVCRRIYFNK